MFLCRAGRRLSAAAPDRVFHAKSPGSSLAHVNANGPRRASLTLRGGHAFRLRRTPCASAGAPVAHLEKLQPAPHLARSWGGQTGFVIARWRRLDRVVPEAATPPRSVPSEGGGADVIGPPLVRAGGLYIGGGTPRGDVLFTGGLGVSSRRCSTGTMHVRASSTDAKKSDGGGGEGERTTDGGKRDEQNLKEALATSSSTEKTPGDPEPEGGKPNKTQQLKKIFKEYGAVGVSFHIGISLMSLGMFYLLISSGMDMAAVLCKLGFSEAVVRSKMAAGTSTFVLAYAIHKLFAPVRISITLVSVPLIVRYFRKTGLFKPPTPAP